MLGSKGDGAGGEGGRPVSRMWPRRDLRARRAITLELPEFLVFALEQRVAEANDRCAEDDLATLNEYIESELVNLTTVRDVAELESRAPGFSIAVAAWLDDIRA